MAINLYKLLNIPRDASLDEIRRAIEVATSYGSLDEKMRVTAQKVLLNPTMRREYDQRLAEGQATQPSSIPAAQPQSSKPLAVATEFAGVETFTPYRAPQSEVSDVYDGKGMRASGRLFTPDGIGIVTFLVNLITAGGIIVGGILLFINFRRLGKSQMGAVALLICGVVYAVLTEVGAGIISNQMIMDLVISIGLPIAIMLYAKSTQGVDIQLHQDAGGKMFSNWLALSIGLLLMLGAAALIIMPSFLSAMADRAAQTQ